MTPDSPEFDFYISATSESDVAQEVARVLRDAGYTIYLPEQKDEAATKRFAASKSKTFVLPLMNDNQQSQFLADILNFAPLGIAEGRVVVIQFEDCELAGLIDPNLVTNLSGLTDSRARKLRIINAVEAPLPTSAPTEADEVPAPGPEEDTPPSEVEPFAPANGVAPDPPQENRGIEKVNSPSGDARKEHAASFIPPAAVGQGGPGPPRQHIRYEEAIRPSADVFQKRLASSIPPADVDQSESGPIHETGDPAIDDPLTALVDIISEKDPVRSSLQPAKWLSKELAAARVAPASLNGKARRDNHNARPAAGREPLEFAVSHPIQFSMGVPFIVDALIYRQNDRRLAVLRAAELSSDNDRFRSSGSAEAVRGSKLRVTLGLPWRTEPAAQMVDWSGALSNVSFQVVTPKYATSKTMHGTCGISVDGLTIGQVHFELQLNNGDHSYARQISRAAMIKSAFASYANQDRRRVLARIQGVEQLGVSVFADVNGLRGNEQSKKQIFQVIDSSDVLYLFWSKHAKRSTWIEQEWRYGMERKGAGFINFVPLVDPNKAPPPPELANQKLFQNSTVINSDDGKSLSLWEKVRSWLGT
jgi:hypothetical protein